MPTRFAVSPTTYRRVADVTLAALAVIVAAGAAVRLTGSGLGCPDWPKCFGNAIAPLETHAVIEYTNRLFSGFVGLLAVATWVLAYRRRPFRRDLARISLLLPLGIAGQGVLGGITVQQGLRPGYVMGHFGLSMLILIAAVALSWRARFARGERPPAGDRSVAWLTRGLLVYGGFVILVGMVTTAAGPHAGASGTGEFVPRLDFHGADTLNWLIHWHARFGAALGVAVVALWFLARRRPAAPGLLPATTWIVWLLVAQGTVGDLQYRLHLPAELVWLHVSLATGLWVALLWAVAVAGRPAPRATAELARAPEAPEAPRLEAAAR